MRYPEYIQSRIGDLNRSQRRALRAHRMLTHAFFCCCEYSHSAGLTLLKLRHKVFEKHQNDARLRRLAGDIEEYSWLIWCDEAQKAGLRP